jgi:serine/threonine protein kinase
VATEFAQGTRLAAGRYTLQRLLGRGGTSAVWLADDTRLGRPVAVKLLSAPLSPNGHYLERFRREARIASRLAHPNLIPIYDFGEEPTPFLVMEYVGGGSLADHLRGAKGFVGEPAELARELLGALAHVHAAGIVHRDIKPENVLIGADGRARLTDFGIARHEDATQLTQAGFVIGTLKYLAPEVLRGAPASPASDLFACGALFGEVLAKQSEPRLEALVVQLSARDPGERPRTAVAALDLLDAAGAPMVGAATAVTLARPRRNSISSGRRGPTHLTQPTRVTRPTRQVGRLARARALILLTGAVAVIVALVLAALSGSGGGRGAAPAPKSAPLGRQLDALSGAVERYTAR